MNKNKKIIALILMLFVALPTLFFYQEWENNVTSGYYTNMTEYVEGEIVESRDGMRIPYVFGRKYSGNIDREDIQCGRYSLPNVIGY